MLYYFTGSDKRAQEHLDTTIYNSFNIGKYKSLIYDIDPKVIDALRENNLEEWVHMRGATPGSSNTKRWERLQINDWMLVYSKKVFLFSSQVVAKLHSKELAQEIWGTNDSGEAWEYIFFLKNVQAIDVPVERFNAFFGYSPNFIAQGFSNVNKISYLSKLNDYDGDTEKMINDLSNHFQVSEEYYEEINFQTQINNKHFNALIDEVPSPKAKTKIVSNNFRKWKRDAKTSKSAIVKTDYQCEVDAGHFTFYSKLTGEPYMEAHHLIPMSEQHRFEYSLDVLGNVVSLCPNCHRRIHHAENNEKKEMLELLLTKRQNLLNDYGINTTKEELERMYFI